MDQGPQADWIQYDSIMNYIKSGITEGAKGETEVKPWGNEGFYI